MLGSSSPVCPPSEPSSVVVTALRAPVPPPKSGRTDLASTVLELLCQVQGGLDGCEKGQREGSVWGQNPLCYLGPSEGSVLSHPVGKVRGDAETHQPRTGCQHRPYSLPTGPVRVRGQGP